MSHTGPVVALVVAAGSGVRFEQTSTATPKALRLLGGRSLLVHALERLYAGGVTVSVVVVPESTRGLFEAVLTEAFAAQRWRIVLGGTERQDSVRNGLSYLDNDPQLSAATVVLIHDAARPLVPPAVVASVIDAVEAGALAVVPVVPVVDTVRRVGTGPSTVVDRAALRAVQTPQGFDRVTVTRAHAEIARVKIAVTDDAAACEHAGHLVQLVDGDRSSIKITEPIDLIVAEALLDAARRPGSAV
ncbi:MAG: 2-C-methyl-D-erythritol 4-phosphate cytidylyltransferase [Propionibacteriaceae bacterium]